MPDAPIATSPGPEGPAPGAQDKPQPAPGAGKRWWQKPAFRPIVLGALGLALLLISFLLYPRTTELPSPAFPRLALSTTFPVAFIDYTVVQVSPTVAEMKISVVLPSGIPGPPAGAPAATLAVAPPFGTSFRDCPFPTCIVKRNGLTSASVWFQQLTFAPVNSTGTATTDLFVKASSFGVTSDGINASAAVPEVLYKGLGQPMMLVLYHLQSASSYDWSAAQVAAVSSTTAQWQQDITGSDTPGRAAVGVDHSGQTRDDIKIFIAGALLGIAGGAIIAAVQEAMHLGGRPEPAG
jgi:hypothetical protein